MIRIRHSIEHIFSFSTQHLWAFFLLSLVAFLQAFNIVLFDSLSTGLYLGKFASFDLSFNFYLGAISLFLGSMLVLKIHNHFGNGFITFLLFATFAQSALFFGFYKHFSPTYDIFLSCKWAYRFIIFTGFWSYAFRFIARNLKSKRFLCLICCEMIGFTVSGATVYLMSQYLKVSTQMTALILTTILLVIVLSRISVCEKITPELELKRKTGINDKSQKQLVFLIYVIAFLAMTNLSFIDYTFCLQLLHLPDKTTPHLIGFIALTWSLYGASAFILLLSLYAFRRSFHILFPLIVFAFLPIVCFLGNQADLMWVVLFSKIALELIFYFCIGYYFRMLAYPLALGIKRHIDTVRLKIAQPLGFSLPPLMFYLFSYSQSALWIALTSCCCFLIFLIRTQIEYAHILIATFKTYRWRGGRLIIANSQILQYITQKTKSRTPQEAIYFLRVLEQAQIGDLKHQLNHALNHISPQVRCFALESIERNNLRMFKKTLSNLIDKDIDIHVRQKALEVFCALDEKYALEKAVLFIEDAKLRKGAITGLIKNGGEGLLMASTGLQKLVFSTNAESRLEATKILQDAPIKGFFHFTKKLMQDTNPLVKKEAILASGYNKHPDLLPLLFETMNEDIQFRDEILMALKNYGTRAYSAISVVFGNEIYTDLCQKTLISYLWSLKDFEALNVILNALKKLPLNLRNYALDFLLKEPIKLSKKQRKKIFIPLIDIDLKQALTTLLIIKDFQTFQMIMPQNCVELLIQALYTDFLTIQQAILKELSLLLPLQMIKKSTTILLNNSQNEADKKVAIETILDLLPQRFKNFSFLIFNQNLTELLPLLPAGNSLREESMTGQVAFILRSRLYRSLWTKLCALTFIRRNNNTKLSLEVQSLLDDRNPIIRENALWVLDRLLISKKERKLVFSLLLKDKNKLVQQMARALLEVKSCVSI